MDADGARSILQAAFLAAYVLVQVLLVLYSSHRYMVLWRWWRTPRRPTREGGAIPLGTGTEWPRVTVQLPVYNERYVVERLIDAAAALDYPPDRLEIQVLDDSTDDTQALAMSAVSRLRTRGVDVHYLARRERAGFKAGALAAGLARARGELVAVFDADFVPEPDFLRRIVPRFVDPSIGMIQARWGHLNRRRSFLTAAQAVMLDAHFVLEHATREARGLFFNFNGTAGVWRRRCIEDAGGWSHDTLTEDLDLSYRAQLRGWRFGYASDVVALAELPADIGALKSQQRRWAKGSIQTARKLLPAVLDESRPRTLRLEALVHLTANAAYPLLLALGLLLLPVLLGTPSADPWLVWTVQIGVWVFGVAPTLLFLIVGQRALGVGWMQTGRDVAAALALGVGLSFNNSRAVLEGLLGKVGAWERTPKTGDREGRTVGRTGYPVAGRMTGAPETGLAVYFAALAGFAWVNAYDRAIPFLLLLWVGFAWVAIASLRLGRRAAPR